ncbi:hypothetical protein [Chitinophaga pinensis]|nr:hypothetical protein [Chitinophaga pinensis]
MRAAVIDLGTNTFHLIIADVSAQERKILYKPPFRFYWARAVSTKT